MTGVGRAGGAGTIVNAFATGRGAAFGLDWRVRARVAPARATGVWNGRRKLTPAEARLATETARCVLGRLGRRERLRIDVESEIPPKRGLKSSSAVAVAVARAVLAHVGARMSDVKLLELVADAAVRSGTSLTGALDDAAACLWGGVVFTDNDRRRVLGRGRLPPDLVALVHVPRRTLLTGSLRRRHFRPVSELVATAWRLARRGEYRDAMLLNTLAYAPLLRTATDFTFQALARGAAAAGLSGKGPAEIALVRRAEIRDYRDLAGSFRRVPLRPGGRRA